MPDVDDRLARLAAQRGGSQRQVPAQASKIIAAGLSTSMILGLVAVMGWTAEAETTQSPTPVPSTVPVATPIQTAPATPTTVAAGAASTEPSLAVVPAETATTVAPQPVVVELTVPQAQPAAGGGGAVAASSQSN